MISRSSPIRMGLLKPNSVIDLAIWRTCFLERGSGRCLADLCRMYEAGQVTPPVTETYPLAEAGRALRRLLDRAAMGKIVLHT
jgi:NADPH:quinone reductase-like Zn-dependent oxidoreductase